MSVHSRCRCVKLLKVSWRGISRQDKNVSYQNTHYISRGKIAESKWQNMNFVHHREEQLENNLVNNRTIFFVSGFSLFSSNLMNSYCVVTISFLLAFIILMKFTDFRTGLLSFQPLFFAERLWGFLVGEWENPDFTISLYLCTQCWF